jgi:hypothetical protein
MILKYRAQRSKLRLLRDGQGIIYLDPKITNGTFQLGTTEQQLHRTQVSCPLRATP